MALPPIASFLVPSRTKDPGAAANFGLALSSGTRPLSSSTRELMKRRQDSRFLRYRTFFPSWIGDFGPINPTF